MLTVADWVGSQDEKLVAGPLNDDLQLVLDNLPPGDLDTMPVTTAISTAQRLLPATSELRRSLEAATPVTA